MGARGGVESFEVKVECPAWHRSDSNPDNDYPYYQ